MKRYALILYDLHFKDRASSSAVFLIIMITFFIGRKDHFSKFSRHLLNKLKSHVTKPPLKILE